MASLSMGRSAACAPSSWHPSLQSVQLNQDCSCVSAGGPAGFSIVELRGAFRRHAFPLGGGIRVCQMLDCSSLVAIVGGGHNPAFSPRRVRLFNTSRAAAICEKIFDYPVVAVRVNYHCMLVVLERRIHLFNIDTMEATHRLDTAPNPLGVCSMQHVPSGAAGPGLRSMVLCYPASAEKGSVCVFDAVTQKVVHIIEAHQAPIQALALSRDGAFLATASTKGTLIRVFDIAGVAAMTASEATMTFRRGVTSSTITTMRFNDAGTLLCVASSHGTIHIFPLIDLSGVEAAAAAAAAATQSSGGSSTTGRVASSGSSSGMSSSSSVGAARPRAPSLADPSAAVAAAAATASTAAQSIFNGFLTTLPTSLSSQRRKCAVNVEPGLSFTCGFLSSWVDQGVGDGDESRAGTRDGALRPEKEELFPGANDQLVVCTSMGIVSLHGFDVVEGTSQLEHQEFLFEQ